jgi:putative membrane protein
MIPSIGTPIIVSVMIGVCSGLILMGTGRPYSLGFTLAAIAVAFVATCLVFLVPYAFYIKAYIKRYVYDGEASYITIKKGVFAPSEIHVQYQKIQDVYVDQDVLDRIMGLYDVHIASATAASGIEAHIDGVEKEAAEGLKKFFLDKLSNPNQQAPITVPGGVGAPMATPMQQVTPVAQDVKLNLTEEISSDRYPLLDKWFWVETTSRIIKSIITAFLIVFVIFAKTKHSTFMESIGWMALSFVGLAVVIIIWNVISLLLWKKNYAFKFTPDNIYYKDGVISISEKHMPYSSIQDVTVSQGVLDRMFGIAGVRIENAATQSITTKNGRVAVFNGIVLLGISLADARKITEVLKSSVLGRNSSRFGL